MLYFAKTLARCRLETLSWCGRRWLSYHGKLQSNTHQTKGLGEQATWFCKVKVLGQFLCYGCRPTSACTQTLYSSSSSYFDEYFDIYPSIKSQYFYLSTVFGYQTITYKWLSTVFTLIRWDYMRMTPGCTHATGLLLLSILPAWCQITRAL